MRHLIMLVEKAQLDEIERGADLNDDWEDQEGEFEPSKLGVPGKEDPAQPKLFPDEELPRRVKPGASPYGDKTPMVMVGDLHNYGLEFTVARPRSKYDDDDHSAFEPAPEADFEDEVFFVVFDDITPVAYVRGKIGSVPSEIDGNGGTSIQVSGVRVDKAYAKRGVGLAIYAWLMKNVADWVEADEIQSEGGVKIWENMVKNPMFEVVYEHPSHSDTPDEVDSIETPDQLKIAYDYEGGRLLATLKR